MLRFSANLSMLFGEYDFLARFEKLRGELEEMGMFAPEYKQPIPPYAKTIGIVTAPTGAAIRDIIHIAKRRNPYVSFCFPRLWCRGKRRRQALRRQSVGLRKRTWTLSLSVGAEARWRIFGPSMRKKLQEPSFTARYR